MDTKLKQQKRYRRHRRVRARVFGTAKCPRLSVFRSNKHIYLQAVDDEKGKTVGSANGTTLKKDLKNKKGEKNKTKIEIAKITGKHLAEKLIGLKIKEVIFDRGGYKYHGRVKAAAEGLRSGGLKF